jgi:tripartite-type tricarboxylate transporter receptor subunit TctC
MLPGRFTMHLQSISVVLLVAGAACAQDFPAKPIRILVSETGGAGDVAGRIIAQGLTPSLGKPIIIDNRPGAFVSGGITAAAAPDGYTLMITASNLWLQPFLRSNVPFDPVKDFSPITQLTTSPLVVVVHPSVQAKSVQELVALARARPGVLNYGSGNAGSSSHLGPELLKSMTGVNIVRVPFKGVGPALNSLVGGEIQMMIASTGSAMGNVKSGKLRGLASTSAQPSPLVPGLPTVAASGVPGFEFSQTLGAMAPAKTPARIVNRLNEELVRVLKQPEVQQKLLATGVEAVGNSPKELAALIKSDMTRLGKVIKDAGIREE